MKIDQIRKRLKKDRPMTSVTIRMPEDVIEDLKRIAPLKGFTGYQPLMRAYIGQSLRKDIELLEESTVQILISNLKKAGVSEKAINDALSSTAK